MQNAFVGGGAVIDHRFPLWLPNPGGLDLLECHGKLSPVAGTSRLSGGD
jgi:hypothetical protein